MTAKLH